MIRITKLSAVVVFLLAAGIAVTQTNSLGIFTDQGSVGQTPPGCKALYDPSTREYRVTGGGENVWDKADAFYFVWKKVSGNLTFTADVHFLGNSSAEHRKAMLMVRQSLDPGSVYADAVSHGNGLTSLQFRGLSGEQTYQVSRKSTNPLAFESSEKAAAIRCTPGSRGPI
jgi:TolB protein